jgi:hypothetical protein
VDGCVVVTKEPVVVAPKLQSLSPHIFSQASQNITVTVRVNCRVRKNKFTVNNPLHIKKKTISMLFVELGLAIPFLLLVIVGSSTLTIVALFLDHNHKLNFHHPL